MTVSYPHVGGALSLVGLVCVSLTAVRSAPAQVHAEPVRSVPELGFRGGFDVQLESGSLGGQLRVPLAPFAVLLASGDYYLQNGIDYWQANADAGFHVLPTDAVYGGIGVALSRRQYEEADRAVGVADTKLGVNLLAGIAPPRRSMSTFRPYAETRWTFVSDFDPLFSLVAGLNLRLWAP
jgi:hypothetical protein